MSGVYTIRTLTLDPVTWTPIASPVNCNYFSVQNLGNNTMFIRTDAEDSNTEVPVSSGGFELLVAEHGGNSFRFDAGDIIFWARVTAGTGPVVCRFMR